MAIYKQAEVVRQNQSPAFDAIHAPRTPTPFSGIYRCEACGFEIVSSEDHPLPALHRQHPANLPIQWRLVVYAN
ncbi:hypothetical protein Q4S45_13205 [Massilia sp. R2A-15]|uniref:hypothetical protein n=1 Tax=Massilia sp. R2A-15 TaxID=3064278 RepID=UPI002733C9F4|nr:hypothetical protein [Massilia sp. R2A-15]WLI87699.1 hypothetical protein Q4S45_13205 [Massilia sp. R2A-15]